MATIHEIEERPILFSAPMVRAILAGAKTQTRRLVRPQPEDRCPLIKEWGRAFRNCAPHDAALGNVKMADGSWGRVRCPHGLPGDRMWVRETFSGPWCMGDTPPSKWGRSSRIWYWADGNPEEGDWTRPRPSIHMPRWASRLTLEITSVRVEQLQEISDENAFAEGAPCYVCGRPMDGFSGSDCHCFHRKARASDYQMLWESIHGPDSWAANPWVWVIEFKRAENKA